MKVIINLISYEQPEFEVQTTTTISELKKAFQDEIGIPMQNFILKYKGQTLEDKMTLADYNISDKDILDIEGNLISTLRPRYVNIEKASGMTWDSRGRRGLNRDAKMSNVSDLLLEMKTLYS